MEGKGDQSIIGLRNGYGLLFETLINRLHASGALSRLDFCDELQAVAAKVEQDWSEHPEVFDLSVVRTLVQTLRDRDRGPISKLPVAGFIEAGENANDNREG